MTTAMEVRSGPRRKLLRSAILWISVGLIYVGLLSWAKGHALQVFANRSLETLRPRHQKILSLFQASFYFFYDEQFLPGLKQALQGDSDVPPIDRVHILSNTGVVLFDSANPPKKGEVAASSVYSDPQIIAGLKGTEPQFLPIDMKSKY